MRRDGFKLFAGRLYSFDETDDLLSSMESVGLIESVPNDDAVKIGREWYVRNSIDSMSLAIREHWNDEREMRRLLLLVARRMIKPDILAHATAIAFSNEDVKQPSELVASGLGAMMSRVGVRPPFQWREIQFNETSAPNIALAQLELGIVSPKMVADHYFPIESDAIEFSDELAEVWEILIQNQLRPAFEVVQLDDRVFAMRAYRSKWPKEAFVAYSMDNAGI